MDVEPLIRLVRETEAIYNPKHPKHRDRLLIAFAWRKIASELNASVAAVKTKWHNLRSNYMREIRKLKNVTLSPLESATPKITWPYFENLRFLDVALPHKTSVENVSDIESSNIDDYFEEYLEDSKKWSQEEHQPDTQQEPELAFENESRRIETSRSIPHPEISETVVKRQKICNDIEYVYDSPHIEAVSGEAQGNKDSDFMFLRSLLPFIKKLGPIENLEFRADVINLLKSKMH